MISLMTHKTSLGTRMISLSDSQSLNHQLQNSLEDAQMIIVDYATSTSWKFTRPLRRFSKWIKKR